MLQSIEEFMTLHSKLIQKMFQELGEIRPFLVLMGDNEKNCQVKPVIIPTMFFETEIGKTFVKSVVLKKEIDELKTDGYELRCVSFSSECWMKKIVVNNEGIKVEKDIEVVVVSYEMKGDSLFQVYEIKRNMNVTDEGLEEKPTLELCETISNNKNVHFEGMMTKLFQE